MYGQLILRICGWELVLWKCRFMSVYPVTHLKWVVLRQNWLLFHLAKFPSHSCLKYEGRLKWITLSSMRFDQIPYIAAHTWPACSCSTMTHGRDQRKSGVVHGSRKECHCKVWSCWWPKMMTKKIMQFLYGGNSYFQMRPWYKAGYMPDRSK